MAKRKKPHAQKDSRRDSSRRRGRAVAANLLRKPVPSNERSRLKQALGLLRKHIKGYEPADGYDFRSAYRFPSTKRKRLLARAAHLKQLLSTPHDTIVGTTKATRRVLVQFTRQRLRKAKHFIVHKPADNFRVRLRDGRISVVGAFPGRVRTESRYFLFAKRPTHPDDVEKMLRSMLPSMPKGFYVILTGALGDTGEPIQKEMLLTRLQDWMRQYGQKTSGDSTGFTEAIVGFRFMSSKLRGAEIQQAAIDHRRQSMREWNAMKDAHYRAQARGEKPKPLGLTPTARKTLARKKAARKK